MVFTLFEASASESDRQSVAISHQCEGSTVGSAFVYELKESIRRSTQFMLGDDFDDGLSISINCSEKSEKTAFIAITVTYATKATPLPYNMDSFILQCGLFVTDACATQTMARLDEQLPRVHEVLRAKQEFDQEQRIIGETKEFQECVTVLAPNWRQIQNNPNFQSYMSEMHSGLGVPRGEALQDAIRKRDAAATAEMYLYAGRELEKSSE